MTTTINTCCYQNPIFIKIHSEDNVQNEENTASKRSDVVPYGEAIIAFVAVFLLLVATVWAWLKGHNCF